MPLRPFRDPVPPPLAAVVDRAVWKEIKERFQTTGEFRSALARFRK